MTTYTYFSPHSPHQHTFFSTQVPFCTSEVLHNIVWYTGYCRPLLQSCSITKCLHSFLFALECLTIPVIRWLLTYSTYTHTHTQTYMDTQIYIHTYIHTYMHTHTNIHAHTQKYTHKNIRAHTYIHTYTHTYMHTHTNIPTYILAYTHKHTYILAC